MSQKIRQLNKVLKSIFSAFIAWSFLSGGASARDVNLDEIYIKKSSKYLSRLTQQKLDTYGNIDAVLIDKNVIFAGWISGDEIVYVQEIAGLEANLIRVFNLRNNKSRVLGRIPGIISMARISPNGRFIAMKRLISKEGRIPSGDTLIYMIQSGRQKNINCPFPFLDFDIPYDGNSIIYETASGFVEYFPDSGLKKSVLDKKSYKDIIASDNPSLSLFSPDRQSVLVINGGGGSYNAKTIRETATDRLSGITSSSEIFWLDRLNIAFRSGFSGNFSVVKYNIIAKTTVPILTLSMNTNLCYSANARILTFLKDQILFAYKLSDGSIINTGIEGEDASFSATGTKFTSILCKNLFLVNFNSLEKKQINLKRSWEIILAGYSDLKNNNREWENDYSLDYINRKINMYKSLLKR